MQGLARAGYRVRQSLDRNQTAVVFRTGLLVLRPVLRSTLVWPISDDPWPEHLRGPAQELVERAGRQHPAGIVDLAGGGVWLDARDDNDFALLMITCCYSVRVRGFAEFRACVFDGADSPDPDTNADTPTDPEARPEGRPP